MVHEKIKKSETTLAGVTFSIIIAVAFFTGFFLWINSNATESGKQVDAMYNTSYTQLQNEIGKINSTVNNLKSSAQTLTEPEPGFLTAWNGLKGLLGLFQAPLQLINIGWQSYQLMVTPLAGIIPAWLINLIAVGIIAFIVYIIVSIFKGDSNVIR